MVTLVYSPLDSEPNERQMDISVPTFLIPTSTGVRKMETKTSALLLTGVAEFENAA